MKRTFFSLIFFLVTVFHTNGITTMNRKITITLYINNANIYYDSGRTENDIINGYFEKKILIDYSEIETSISLEKLLAVNPIIVKNSELEKIYKNFVSSLCIIKDGDKEVLRFTYTNNEDEYQLWNGHLVLRIHEYDELVNTIQSRMQ